MTQMKAAAGLGRLAKGMGGISHLRLGSVGILRVGCRHLHRREQSTFTKRCCPINWLPCLQCCPTIERQALELPRYEKKADGLGGCKVRFASNFLTGLWLSV